MHKEHKNNSYVVAAHLAIVIAQLHVTRKITFIIYCSILQRYSWNELNEIFMLKLENFNVENAFETFTTQPPRLVYISYIIA